VAIVTASRIGTFERECFGDIASPRGLLRQICEDVIGQWMANIAVVRGDRGNLEPMTAIHAKPFPVRRIDLGERRIVSDIADLS